MTIWAENEVPLGEGGPVQDRFAQLHLAFPSRTDMMLISVKSEDFKTERLVMSLPEKALLATFPGFTEISEAGLPKVASLLYGSQTAFEQRFQFPISTV